MDQDIACWTLAFRGELGVDQLEGGGDDILNVCLWIERLENCEWFKSRFPSSGSARRTKWVLMKEKAG